MIITGQQAKKEYRDYLTYNVYKFCSCGVMIEHDNVVAAEVEKNINGADVPTLEFFCSAACAHDWLDSAETKKEIA